MKLVINHTFNLQREVKTTCMYFIKTFLYDYNVLIVIEHNIFTLLCGLSSKYFFKKI